MDATTEAFVGWIDHQRSLYPYYRFIQDACLELRRLAIHADHYESRRRDLINRSTDHYWAHAEYVVRVLSAIDLLHMQTDHQIIAALQRRIDCMTIGTVDVDSQRHLLMLMRVGDYGRMLQLMMHCTQTDTPIDPWTVDIIMMWFQIVDKGNVVARQLTLWLDNGMIRQSWQSVVDTMALRPALVSLISGYNGHALLYHNLYTTTEKELAELHKLRVSNVFYTLHPMIKAAIVQRNKKRIVYDITGTHWVHWTSRKTILDEFKHLN